MNPPRLPFFEWDAYTGHYVRRGWIAERQAMMDQTEAELRAGTASGTHTCNRCARPIAEHQLPDRLWSAHPSLCPQGVK